MCFVSIINSAISVLVRILIRCRPRLDFDLIVPDVHPNVIHTFGRQKLTELVFLYFIPPHISVLLSYLSSIEDPFR